MKAAGATMLRACVLFLCLICLSCSGGGVEEISKGNKAAGEKRFARAVEHFSRALDDEGLSSENRVVALNNRGSAYDDLGRPQKAEEDFSAALAIDPGYAGAYYNRSFAREKTGRLAEALEDIKRAVELVSDDPYFQQRKAYLIHKAAGG